MLKTQIVFPYIHLYIFEKEISMKKLSKAISIILCLSLLPSLGIEAFAATDNGEETSASFESVQGESQEVGNIVKELTEERTQFTKE